MLLPDQTYERFERLKRPEQAYERFERQEQAYERFERPEPQLAALLRAHRVRPDFFCTYRSQPSRSSAADAETAAETSVAAKGGRRRRVRRTSGQVTNQSVTAIRLLDNLEGVLLIDNDR
ncbi:unnamed protein product [Parnassius apollo]|uniref:(apollo) hypothetical protein n=1 Tax=Parnassius apollo TaxID=110799 RepID=A0A8S3WPD3_PARAO|nr:unnamed protein product [Parnassius apollo]